MNMIEIDGVRKELQGPSIEAGDYISDEYLRLIDLSTAPDRGYINTLGIASAIRRLNRNLATTSYILGGTELAQPYNDVMGQLNQINHDIPGIDKLQPLITDGTEVQNYSIYFNWGDTA